MKRRSFFKLLSAIAVAPSVMIPKDQRALALTPEALVDVFELTPAFDWQGEKLCETQLQADHARIYQGEKLLAIGQRVSFTQTQSLYEITSKDTIAETGRQFATTGLLSSELTLEAAAAKQEDLYQAFTQGSKLDVVFSFKEGEEVYSQAVLTSLEMSSSGNSYMEDTLNLSFSLHGPLTRAA